MHEANTTRAPQFAPCRTPLPSNARRMRAGVTLVEVMVVVAVAVPALPPVRALSVNVTVTVRAPV